MNVEEKKRIHHYLKEEIEKQYKLKGKLAYNELNDVNLKEKICTELVNIAKNKNEKINESMIDYILEEYISVLEEVNNNFESVNNEQVINNAIHYEEKNNFNKKENNYSGWISGIIAFVRVIWQIIKICIGIFAYVAYFIISLIFGLAKKYK